MTGEHEERPDEQDFDDGESFILEDWEELDQVLSDVDEQAEQHGDLPNVPQEPASGEGSDDAVHHFVLDDDVTGGAPDPSAPFDQFGGLEDGLPEAPAPDPEHAEDVLFHTDPGTGRQAQGSTFTEGPTDWGGEALSAEDIGIPTDVVSPAGPLSGPAPDAASESESPIQPPEEEDIPVLDEVHEVDLDLADDVDFGGEEQSWDSPGATLDTLGEEEPGFQQLELGADINVPVDEPVYEEEAYAEEEVEEEYDPIYGAEAMAAADEAGHDDEQAFESEAEADYTEYDESYVEAGDQWGSTDKPRRRVPLRMFAGLAAVIVVGLGTAAVLKPEWLGMKIGPVLIDRTTVARPDLDLELSPPEALVGEAGPGVRPVIPVPDTTVPDTTVPDTTPPDTTTPDTTPPDTTTPDTTNPDTTTPDVAQTTPDTTPPGTTTPDTTTPDVAQATPETGTEEPPTVEMTPSFNAEDDPDVVYINTNQKPKAAEKKKEEVEVGDDMLVGERSGVETTEMQPHPMSAGLATGDQAFAQMNNGNFFVGNVKTITAGLITLRVDRGEVTLDFNDLRVLGTASSPEFAAIQNSRPGFVRLANQNRLIGNIMKSGENGRVSLNIDAQQILIPAEEIEEVGRGTEAGVRITAEEEDDAWIQQLIEQRIEKRRLAEEQRAKGRNSSGQARDPDTGRIGEPSTPR